MARKATAMAALPAITQRVFSIQTHQPLAPGVPAPLVSAPLDKLFRVTSIAIPDNYRDATIHGIVIGGKEQLVAPMPAAAFTPDMADTIGGALATVRWGETITMTVSRPDGGDFGVMFVGASSDDLPPPEPLVEEAELAKKLLDEMARRGRRCP